MLREALTQLSTTSGAYPNPRSVGMKLHHLRERVIGGHILTNGTGTTAAWFVAQTDSITENPQSTLLNQQPSGTTWTTGTDSNPSATRFYGTLPGSSSYSIEGAAASPSSPTSPIPETHSADKEVF